MILSKISFFIIAGCIIFLLVHRKIQISPVVRGISCVTLLSIISIFAKDQHKFLEQTYISFNVTIASIVVYVTYLAHKRGYL